MDGYQYGETEDYLLAGGQPPAKEGDAGDAPDSSNHQGMRMEAYAETGGAANFPTVYDPATGTPPGPMHWEQKDHFWLGETYSVEKDADKMPSEDGITNIDPISGDANRDMRDDGLIDPFLLQEQPARLWVKVASAGPETSAYINVWLDWNRDGDWEDTFSAGDLAVPEWVVQNHAISLQPGVHDVELPSFLVHNPKPEWSIWMRITLSEAKVPLNPETGRADGRGPDAGYKYGETEDYLIGGRPQPRQGDLGDAPDNGTHDPTYPKLEAYPGILGNFPTLYEPGDKSPPGPMHWKAKEECWLGNGVSVESEAHENGIDEDGVTNISYSQSAADRDKWDDGKVSLTPLRHGQMAELKVKYSTTESGFKYYLNVWFDWNRDGDWEDEFSVSGVGSAGVLEWVVQDFAVTKPAGAHEVTLPAFLVYNPTPEKPLWMRVTLSEQQAPLNPDTIYADGRGPASGYLLGETEDYLLPGGPVPAKEGDAGDAPDSSNHADAQIEAYPGVPGNFPTVYDPANGAPSGPMHWEAKVDSWLGAGVSVEADADKMPDEDGHENIIPPYEVADLDKKDDGIVNLTPLVDAQTAKLEVKVTVKGPKQQRFLNVWLDWNRDGDWEDTFPTDSEISLSEWVVQDYGFALGPGTHQIVLPDFPVVRPDPENPLWMRITLSDGMAPLNPQTNLADGRGPDTGYKYGETEDYLVPGKGSIRTSCNPGDVTGDGQATALDASLILQYVVGLIDEFPVQRVSAPADIEPRDYTARIDQIPARENQRVRVPVQIADAAGLTSGGIRVTYDPRILKAVDVSPSLPLSGAYWQANPNMHGEVRFAFASTGVVENGGTLFSIEFEVLPNTEGLESPLRLESVELTGSRQVHKIDGRLIVLPRDSQLLPNYPNPFNPETWIPYQLAEDATVLLRVFSSSGQLVRQFDLGYQRAGSYVGPDKAIYWDGRNAQGERVGSGVYLYQLMTPNFQQTRRMVILK